MASHIPKILHQTWKTADLPPPFAAWRAGWIGNHRGWDHRLHDDDAIARTLRDRAPEWIATFDALPRMIQRIDFFRYLIVYLDGGLYADIDMISYLPCDPLLEDATCVLGIENHLHGYRQRQVGFSQPWQLANFIFAAAPGHPFMRALLEEIARKAAKPALADEDVEDTTGPMMLTRLAGSLPPSERGAIKVLPQVNWNPPLLYRSLGPLRNRIYARHQCAGTWRTAGLTMQGVFRALGRRPPNPLARVGPSMPGPDAPSRATPPASAMPG